MKSREHSPPIEAESKRKAYLQFGGPGHPGEYTLNLEDYDSENFIPDRIGNALKNELGEEWTIDNRGTRLEIMHNTEYGKRDDEKIHEALKKVLGDRYEF